MLPDKFIIPSGRIPKAFDQGLVGSCVACTMTKILEVINYIKTGEYTELSKGYMYGRNNDPNKKNQGMDEERTLNILMTRGSVPAILCKDYGEVPEIIKTVNARADIDVLDRIAEQYKIKGWELIPGNAKKFKNIKEYLYKYQMPLAGHMPKYRGEVHCAVIVGWDGNNLIWQNHDKTGELRTIEHGRFNYAYYIDGGIEEMSFKKFDVNGFKKYMEDLKVERKIERIQLHHTYSPSYAQFKGNNHDALQKGMQNYHINTNGWADIGQHLTIFPDGVIMTGRRFDAMPAGIFGANSGAICIECLGNFDKGGDIMTEAQKTAIVATVKILLDKFKLKAEDDVTYHAWWTSSGSDLGDYVKGKSAKTCPGTNFFGGNTLTAYEKNLMPLIKNYGKEEKAVELKPVTEINDIVWELTNAGIITDGKLWMQKCKDDINVYWLCRKMANKLRGTLK
jgi:hypothetical protein